MTKKMMTIRAVVLAAIISSPARAGDPGRIVFVAQNRNTENLFAVNADGSGFVQLTHLPERTILAYAPAWSPDGRYIAFDGRDGIYFVPAVTPGTPVLACRGADVL